jgi:hypothetical protein
MPPSLLKTLENPDALPQLIGEFLPIDEWQQHVNRLFYGLRSQDLGKHARTFATADFRLAHALAADYFSRASAREKAMGKRHQARDSSPLTPHPSPLTIMEWGCGNGNLAACFLSHLKRLDQDGVIYPRVRYVLVDRYDEILKTALRHPDLAEHRDRVEVMRAEARDLGGVKDHSVDRIFCNELWNELPTKLMLRKQSDVLEEHLRPNVTAAKHAAITDWSAFVRAFGAADVAALRAFPAFLDEIVWEREYQPVAWQAVPYRKIITEFLKKIDEEVLVPVNLGAFSTLKEAKRLLTADSLGFSSFDAGTADLGVLNDPDKPCYGQFGGQYSFMINYALVQAIADHLGIKPRTLEPQQEFVGRSLGARVVGLLDLLSTHPKAGSLGSIEQDRLVLQTIQALNAGYESPYQRRLDFSLREDLPVQERENQEALLRSLKENGVPDTIAYLTEDEVLRALPGLADLGYQPDAVRRSLPPAGRPIDYFHWCF